MGGYIRLEKDQPNDARLVDLADVLADRWMVAEGGAPLDPILTRHVLRHAVTGALVTLWCYADTHIRSDNSLPVTLSGVTQIVNLPVTVLELFPSCWLQVREDGLVVLPDYCRKNGIRARDLRKADRDEKQDHEREMARARKRKQRDKSRRDSRSDTRRDMPVTPPPVTPPTGTGPGTHPIPGPGTENRETPSASRGELASAMGRLARRGGLNGAAAARSALRPTKTRHQLEADARKLAGQGESVTSIAKILSGYGVTEPDVSRWLANSGDAPLAAGEGGA